MQAQEVLAERDLEIDVMKEVAAQKWPTTDKRLKAGQRTKIMWSLSRSCSECWPLFKSERRARNAHALVHLRHSLEGRTHPSESRSQKRPWSHFLAIVAKSGP
jgi:hypothetical protein